MPEGLTIDAVAIGTVDRYGRIWSAASYIENHSHS